MTPALHGDVASFAFLMGTWRGEGHGSFPTIDPFDYGEELVFEHVGDPYLLYSQRAGPMLMGRPLHFERGFLRPGATPGRVELCLAHPLGLTEVAEGTLDGTAIELAASTTGSAAPTPATRRHRLVPTVAGRRRPADLRARHGDGVTPLDPAPRPASCGGSDVSVVAGGGRALGWRRPHAWWLSACVRRHPHRRGAVGRRRARRRQRSRGPSRPPSGSCRCASERSARSRTARPASTDRDSSPWSASLALGEYLAGAVIALMLASGAGARGLRGPPRAPGALGAARARAAGRCTRYEDGDLVARPIEEVVPADRLFVKTGEVVPVDGRAARATRPRRVRAHGRVAAGRAARPATSCAPAR